MRSHPFLDFVNGYTALFEQARALTYPDTAPKPLGVRPNAPKALLFSPHPDDECIIGALPLRLRRELGFRIVNVAVTQGSNQARQAERWQELEGACGYLSFDLVRTAANGLEHINLACRERDPARWQQAVTVITAILTAQRPTVIFFPHQHDANRTHIGTHYLLLDALARQPADFSCLTVETEFWSTMDAPNLMIESSSEQVADLIAALTHHRGEIARNPYHLRLPAWMMDNVRRGSEQVAGQGERAPAMHFATLYRLRRWSNGALRPVIEHGQVLSRDDSLDTLFGCHSTP